MQKYSSLPVNDDSDDKSIVALIELAKASATARRNRVEDIYAANNGKANW